MSPEELGLTMVQRLIWRGWLPYSDRQVIRDAVAKGGNINLALLFLTHRRRMDKSIIQVYFDTEVLEWFDELLRRSQITRAIQMLERTKLNVVEEVTKRFLSSDDKQIRDSLGNFLSLKKVLSQKILNIWNLLMLMERYDDLCQDPTRLENLSINSLMAQNDQYISEIATKLFIRTEDDRAVPFINMDMIWVELQRSENHVILKKWINISFNDEYIFNDSSKLMQYFKHHPLTYEYFLKQRNVHKSVMDEFAKFGMFNAQERSNIRRIIRRLKDADVLQNVYKILASRHSRLSVEQFLDLLLGLCINESKPWVLGNCVNCFKTIPDSFQSHSRFFRMFCDIRSLVANFTESTLTEHIVKYHGFFNYTEQDPNPIEMDQLLYVFLAILNDKSPNEYTVGSSKLLITFPLLVGESVKNSSHVTLKRLLQSECLSNISIRFEMNALLDFEQKQIKAIAYSKVKPLWPLLRQARPIWIYQHITYLPLEKLGKFALENYYRTDIAASCVTLLHLAGLDTDKLRSKLSVLSYVYNVVMDKQFIGATIDNNLLQAKADEKRKNEVCALAPDDPKSIQVIMNLLRSSLSLIKFHRYYQTTTMPEAALKHFASHNMWLPFVILAQMGHYPRSHLRILINHFKNVNIMEHVRRALDLDIKEDQANSIQILERMHLLPTCVTESGVENPFEFDMCILKTTLLKILVECNNSADPPKALLQAALWYRNPFLVIMANLYEPGATVICWLNWLVVSCEDDDIIGSSKLSINTPEETTQFLVQCMLKNYPRTILQSFEIFLPDNRLILFLKAVIDMIEFRFDAALPRLNLFAKLLRDHPHTNYSIPTDVDHAHINGSEWLNTTARQLLWALLDGNCVSTWHQEDILDTIRSSKLCWAVDVLQKAVRITSEFGVQIPFMQYQVNQVGCMQEIISKLASDRHYETALELCRVLNAPTESVFITRWQHLFADRQKHGDFWADMDKSLRDKKVSSASALSLFKWCLERLQFYDLEKFSLLKLACDWGFGVLLYEFDLWLCFLKSDMPVSECVLLEPAGQWFLYGKLLDVLMTSYPTVNPKVANFDAVDKVKCRHLIHYLLDHDRFATALKMEHMFQCTTDDLTRLKLAVKVAEDLISPTALNTEDKELLSDDKYIRRIDLPLWPIVFSASCRMYNSGGSGQAEDQSTSAAGNETATFIAESRADPKFLLLLNVFNCTQYGLDICRRILILYKISINLGYSYSLLATCENPLEILQDVLSIDCPRPYQNVLDFCQAFGFTGDAVSQPICAAVIEAVNNVASGPDPFDKILVWNVDILNSFRKFSKLMGKNNSSLLGQKILSYATILHKSKLLTKPISINDCGVIVLLLIVAHKCFSFECNVESITKLLRRCKKVFSSLVEFEYWRLAARLFTGIGRYTEMGYALETLIHCDQFEYVLHRETRDNVPLKRAILAYMLKITPKNKDLFRIVAIHFSMYSEVAEIWEEEAKTMVGTLRLEAAQNIRSWAHRSLRNNLLYLMHSEANILLLRKIMQYHIDACQFYSKAEQYKTSLATAKLAELTGLQIALIREVPLMNFAPCILNLDEEQILYLLQNNLSFDDGLIVVEAFDANINWCDVIYYRYIKKNDRQYYENYKSVFGVSEKFAISIKDTYMQSERNVEGETNRMKQVILNAESILLKYLLASEMGFMDIATAVMNGHEVAYLKDTVWKAGNNPTANGSTT